MGVRPGYKQTEAGVIPNAWGTKSLDAIAIVTSGKRLPLGASLTERETARPYVRVTDMRPGTVSLADIKYVPVEVSPAIKRYRIFKDDIFITVAGTLGIVGKIPSEINGANLTENADRITNISCSQDYLLYVLMSPLIQSKIDSLQTVGAQPKLALTRIRKFDIPLPPTKSEQEAIAEALSDADALIESLEQLLTKKRQIKKGAMQELLTGEKRLPGFSGEWKLNRLAQVADVHRKNVVPALSGDTLFMHFSLPAFDGGRRPVMEFGEEIGSNKFSVPESAVLVSKLNPRISRVWAPIYVGSNAVASTEFLVLTPRDRISRIFLYFLCLSPRFCEQMRLLTSGTTGSHQRISHPEVMNVEVWYPENIVEQRAIATILSDMDAEITALETKLSKAHLIKQGMMQELLTGRIRLL